MNQEEATEAVANFSAALSDIEEKVKRLQSLPWSQICGPDTPPLDSARLHLMVAYAVNALFWMYLRARGEKVAGHPVKAELERVKKALRRVKEAEAQEVAALEAAAVAAAAEQRPSARIDAAAARRFVAGALGGAPAGEAPADANFAPAAPATSTATPRLEAAGGDSGSRIAEAFREASSSADAAAQAANERDAVAVRSALSKSLRDLGRAAEGDAADAEDEPAARALAATVAEHAARLQGDEATEAAHASAAPEDGTAASPPPSGGASSSKRGKKKKKEGAGGGSGSTKRAKTS